MEKHAHMRKVNMIRRTNVPSSKTGIRNVSMKMEDAKSNGIVGAVHSMRSTRGSEKGLEIVWRSKARSAIALVSSNRVGNESMSSRTP